MAPTAAAVGTVGALAAGGLALLAATPGTADVLTTAEAAATAEVLAAVAAEDLTTVAEAGLLGGCDGPPMDTGESGSLARPSGCGGGLARR